MKKRLLVAPLLLACCLSSCNKQIYGKWKTYMMDEKILTGSGNLVNPFDTMMQFNYYYTDQELNNKKNLEIEKLYKDEVVRLHREFDTHYKYYLNEEKRIVYNNAYILEKNYGNEKELQLDLDLYNLLKDSIYYTKLTKGKFNIFAGRLSDFWNDIFDSLFSLGELEELDPLYNIEQKEELDRILAATPKLDEIDSMFTFNDKNRSVIYHELDDITYNGEILERGKGKKYAPRLTLGGIGKGYATALISDKFKDLGYKRATFYSGGSSISTIESPIYNENQAKGYSLKIVDPRTASSMIDKKVGVSLYLKDRFAVSTSGNYTIEKSYSFENEGERIYRHHIIDPNTGYPGNNFRSITLVSTYFDAGILDALSTAFMSLDIESALEFRKEILKEYKNKADLELIAITQEGDNFTGTIQVHSTSTFDDTISVGEGVELKIYE